MQSVEIARLGRGLRDSGPSLTFIDVSDDDPQMDRVTRAKIESLVHELRSWRDGGRRRSLEELVERYKLDPLLIRRIAEAEGIEEPTEEHRAPTANEERDSTPTSFIVLDDQALRRMRGED